MKITKQSSLVAWTVIVALCCMMNTLSAATFGLFTYTDNGTSITITGYPANAVGAVDIPSTIIGKPVTSIGNSAFFNCTSLTSVTIPASITSIGIIAFEACPLLTSITVDSLNAFFSSSDGVLFNKSQTTLIQYPGAKTGSVTIPASVTSIGNYAFSYCPGPTSVTIPASVTSIGSAAFYPCISMTSITVDLLNSVYSSMDGVLFNKNQTTLIQCPGGITGSVTIPASVTSFGGNAFSHCTSLQAITVDALNSVYGSLDGVVFNKSQTTLIQCPGGKAGNFTIPSGVTVIGGSAFVYCTSLTSVTIPSSVTAIRSFAFYNCTSLTSVTIPASVTSIGDYAFQFCASLTGITIPASVTSIGDRAFNGCSHLTSASFMGNVPSFVSSFGINVFSSTPVGFTVYYFNDKTGFTSPYWFGAGNMYPAINMGDSTPTATWLLEKGLPYNADLQTDPNGDGVNLLMAYALNLDPQQNLSGRMPSPVIAGNQMGLTFYAGSAGVTYTVQTSADLHSWSATGVTLSTPDANNYRTATVMITGSNCFMRLVAGH